MATTQQQLTALRAADVALGARIDKEVQARVIGDVSLAGRITLLEEQVKALLVAGGDDGTTPLPPPEPLPLPPPPNGHVISPGTGTIAAARAAGHRALILRGGRYRDAFGSALRVNDGLVTIWPYENEPVVIDGAGLGKFQFVYLGLGSDWRFGPVRIEGFPINPNNANGSAVIGLENGHLELDETVIECPDKTIVDNRCHGLYGYGTGTGILRKAKVLDFPGSALHAYTGSPKWQSTDSEFTARYAALLLWDGVHTISGGRAIGAPGGWDVEAKPAPRCQLTLNGVTGSGSGGALRKVVVP